MFSRLTDTLQVVLAGFFSMAGGPGTFDSIGGTYDTQTSFGFDKQLYYEARAKTLIGSLSKSGRDVEGMYAGAGPSLDGSAVIQRKKIDAGDMVRFTMQEHMKGMPTWGDNAVERGDFLAYKNLEARVNMIKTPAVQIQGEMARQRVKKSIMNIDSAVRQEVVEYTAEEMEFEFLIALHYGASKSALRSVADGGLGVNLGVGSNGTAGTPLLPRHMYTIDSGFLTYSDTPATYNATVNAAINTITATADEITLIKMKVLRRQLDALNFAPAYLGGKKYKAIALCDPDIWYRIDHLLATLYASSRERAAINPVFNVDYQLEYDGILYLNVPSMEKFRMGYQASPDYPTLGPGLTEDPRDYTVTSSVGLVTFVGAGAAFEGFNDSVRLTTQTGDHGDGVEVAGRFKQAYIRGEWYAEDGRDSSVDNVYSRSVLTAAFYEPGVGTDYS